MDEVFKNIWWVAALPLFGFLIQALTGKIIIDNLGTKLGRWVMGSLACLPIFTAFAIAVLVTSHLAAEPATARVHFLTLFDWINVQSLSIPFEFRIDTLSMTMTLIITGIGAFIHLYATGYMAEEKDYARFFTYLNLFIACMLCLVLGNNLVLLFIGWEGVGVCSYLLIGFWYKDLANSKAANKAFIVNRVGDYGLTLGMFLIVWLMSMSRAEIGFDPRWLSYDVILPHAAQIFARQPEISTAIALLLFVGAMGKSAQLPLYFWLPDAMAGPTPVSALIHAATMVTSGVFLLNRMNAVFVASPLACTVVTVIGALTALLGALIAFGQTDIKKVLAFSTVSQLGYMFIACGSGAYWVGIFHVTTHAFFKALLFLGSGAVIHAMSHNQDMRNYGNLGKYIKVTAATMVVGWLAISGFPLLAGFFSKEEVLGMAMNSELKYQGFEAGKFAGIVGFFVAFLTACYMTRLTLLTFWKGDGDRWKLIPAAAGHAHAHHDDHAHAHPEHHDDHGPDTHSFFYSDSELATIESKDLPEEHHDLDQTHVPHEVPISMWLPLVVLAIASVVGGFVLKNVAPLQYWLYPEQVGLKEAETVPHFVLLTASLVMAFGGIFLGIALYRKGLPESEGFDLSKWAKWRLWVKDQFGIDHALTEGSVGLGAMVGNVSFGFDKGLIDGIVNGLGTTAGLLGGMFGKLQKGYVRGYALVMQLGVVALLAYLVYTIMNNGGGV